MPLLFSSWPLVVLTLLAPFATSDPGLPSPSPGACTAPLADPLNVSPGVGDASIVFNDAANTLFIQFSFSGLLGGITQAAVHGPTSSPGTGSAPPALSIPLPSTGLSIGAFSIQVDLSLSTTYDTDFFIASGGTYDDAKDALYFAFSSGSAYLTISTSANSAGEIQGFVVCPGPIPDEYVVFSTGGMLPPVVVPPKKPPVIPPMAAALDLRPSCPPVRNQNPCGSCWAFATIGAFECNIVKKFGELKDKIDLSEQELISCAKAGTCKGGWPSLSCAYLKGHCAFTQECMPDGRHDINQGYPCKNCPAGPYTWGSRKYRIDRWDYVSGTHNVPSVKEIKKAIMDHGVVITLFYVGTSFMRFVKDKHGAQDVFGTKELGQTGLHAVAITGWDDALGVWHVRNSWGPVSGNNGYVNVKYGTNRIGLGTIWLEPTPCPASPSPATTPFPQSVSYSASFSTQHVTPLPSDSPSPSPECQCPDQDLYRTRECQAVEYDHEGWLVSDFPNCDLDSLKAMVVDYDCEQPLDGCNTLVCKHFIPDDLLVAWTQGGCGSQLIGPNPNAP